jgi:outer membrane lipoprotein SlyB
MKFTCLFTTVIVTTIFMAGCTSTNSAALGSSLGRLTGQVVGSKVGGSTGTLVGQQLGAVSGALIGSAIAQYLNEEEQKQASMTVKKALDSDSVGPKSTQTWKSVTTQGTSGGTTVTSQTISPDGIVCKKADSYAKVKGKDVNEPETYCKDPKTGTWTLKA